MQSLRVPEKPKLIRSTNAHIYDKCTTNMYSVKFEKTMQSLRVPEKPKLIRSTNAYVYDKGTTNMYSLSFEEILQKWVSQQESQTEPKEINEDIKS